MENSCEAWAVYGATGSRPRIYSYCLNWHLRTHSLWKDTLLNLDIAGRTVFLPQSDLLDFVDSPWDVLPFLRSGWAKWCGERVGQEEGKKYEQE